tara:strand:- start:162 stop:1073 length:912 start_codon:yes stop_codon:yes gene_type:complete
MPRLGSNFHSLFDSDGVFCGLEGTPSYRELFVKNLKVEDAIAFRSEKRRDKKTRKPYYATIKQPQVLLHYKKEVLFIIDRRVLWDLIRNFDPDIDYRTFLEMLEYFSVYKIVEDYLLDYQDKTIGVWTQKANGESLIVAVQTTDEIQDIIHDEIIKYVSSKIDVDATESFMKIGKSQRRGSGRGCTHTAPKKHRSQILRIIKGDMILEIKDWLTKGHTDIRLFMEHEGYMVQMIKRLTFRKNLSFIPSEILYKKIDNALEVMQHTYRRTGVKTDYRPRARMSDAEWDALQFWWFENYFSKVDG